MGSRTSSGRYEYTSRSLVKKWCCHQKLTFFSQNIRSSVFRQTPTTFICPAGLQSSINSFYSVFCGRCHYGAFASRNGALPQSSAPFSIASQQHMASSLRSLPQRAAARNVPSMPRQIVQVGFTATHADISHDKPRRLKNCWISALPPALYYL